MKLLHIDSSILGANSVSRILSARIVAGEASRHLGLEVTYRDLGSNPLNHLSAEHLAAAQGVSPEGPALRSDLTAGQQALDEFLASDIVVVGAPMYNFGVSSQLKAWIDRLAIAGKTFRYTAAGPEGLAGGKQVIIASSRGGFYGADTPAAVMDHQERYLSGVFGFFGITDVDFVRAEGIALGPDQRDQAVEAALREIDKTYALTR